MQMSLDNLPFNWFDVLLVVVLALGIRHGRKHGMSEELLGMLRWVTIAVGCAFLYAPIGDMLAQFASFSLLSSYLIAYIVIALVIVAVFAGLQKALGGKLVGSEVFGRSEFYLGMLGGLVRFSCILIAGIALLNARLYSQKEITGSEAYQNDVYGTNFFPTLYTIQAQVFDTSLTGPWIKHQMGFLLIKPTAPENKQFVQKDYAVP
jgi:hypothetical protein